MQWGKKDASDEEIWSALKTARPKNLLRKRAWGWILTSARAAAVMRRPAPEADHCQSFSASAGDFNYG